MNIYEAKTKLSRLVEQAAGEEIVIAKAGRPVAKLVPLQPKRAPRQIGMFNGQVKVPENFDTMFEDGD